MSKVIRAHSIALPIFLLVIAAIVCSTAITFAITFAGPPPRPAPVAIGDVAAVLGGEHRINAEGARLTIATGTGPVARSGERPDPRRDAAIAAQIGNGRVVGYYENDTHAPDSGLRGSFTIGWQNGQNWRVVQSPPDRLFARWLAITLGGMAGALTVLALAGWLIARAISRPLRELSWSVAAARLDGGAPAIPGRGPREVRALGETLATMHARMAAHAEGRTAMLAAIAHDLGTPLSRLAYWIERLPEDARTRAAADIEEMRAMLGDVLRFVRDARPGDTARIDLGSVLDSLVDDLSVAGMPVTLVADERALVRGDAPALRRLFANLIENAVRYGDAARVGWTVAGDAVTVHVEDDGPGFDPALGDRLFEPFVRGDPSRNRSTGGTGLGLAIVRGIAESHGGTVTLERAEHGGGRVEVSLPLT